VVGLTTSCRSKPDITLGNGRSLSL
jgi:hypothetical protein